MYPALQFLFLDMDSFFASAEKHLSHELRGRAIGIAPVDTKSSCCIASSYEAKIYGIKTGTKIGEAKSRCTDLKVVPGRPGLYKNLHDQIVQSIEKHLYIERVLSIDELVCSLPVQQRNEKGAKDVAYQVKEILAQEISPWVQCSIGISSNSWLAKIASKTKKPNGITIWDHNDLPEALFALSLSDLHGVGRGLEQRLLTAKIYTVKDLYRSSKQVLHRVWGGIEGDRIWYKLRGQEFVAKESEKRSISHSHVLAPIYRPQKQARGVLHRLVQKAATRLRKYQLLAGSITIYIRYIDRTSWKESVQFLETDDSLFFSKVTAELWNHRTQRSIPILQLGIVFHQLVDKKNYTPSLFQHLETPASINEALDKANDQFGKQALYLGGAHGAIDTAPKRIAFTHIPEEYER